MHEMLGYHEHRRIPIKKHWTSVCVECIKCVPFFSGLLDLRLYLGTNYYFKVSNENERKIQIIANVEKMVKKRTFDVWFLGIKSSALTLPTIE